MKRALIFIMAFMAAALLTAAAQAEFELDPAGALTPQVKKFVQPQ